MIINDHAYIYKPLSNFGATMSILTTSPDHSYREEKEVEVGEWEELEEQEEEEEEEEEVEEEVVVVAVAEVEEEQVRTLSGPSSSSTKKIRSSAWDHFSIKEDKRVYCNYCR
jgi:hypothetical protein